MGQEQCQQHSGGDSDVGQDATHSRRLRCRAGIVATTHWRRQHTGGDNTLEETQTWGENSGGNTLKETQMWDANSGSNTLKETQM